MTVLQVSSSICSTQVSTITVQCTIKAWLVLNDNDYNPQFLVIFLYFMDNIPHSIGKEFFLSYVNLIPYLNLASL